MLPVLSKQFLQGRCGRTTLGRPIPDYGLANLGWPGWSAGCGIVDVEFEDGSLGPGGWFKKRMRDGRLAALTVYYKTPEPAKTGYYAAKYRVHWFGANPHWGKWEYDDGDDYAGNMTNQIDMIELTIAHC